MSHAVYHIGDIRDIVATLDDDSVDLILTSPPFLALRSYLPADHPDKGREIGSEPTPAEFVDTLLELVAGWRRVLAPHGSIAVELGDTYSGSSAGGGDWIEGSGERVYTRGDDPPAAGAQRKGAGWPLAKSLTLIPELFRIALVYGINPLTGQPSPAGKWRVRNVVRWVRPNPPVGALGDKYRPATSEMVIACVSDKRWFDLDAVRNPNSNMEAGGSANSRQASGDKRGEGEASRRAAKSPKPNPAGAPPLDWWNIPTHPYPGSHYATWPPELCRIPIESMCPRHVCRECGEPRRRVMDHNGSTIDHGEGQRNDGRLSAHSRNRKEFGPKILPTGDWSTCDCPEPTYRPGHVLDPFAGTGTTLAVATGHGRDATGIDIDPRNADLAQQRVGMFLTVNETERSA